MKKKNKTGISPLIMMGVLLMLISSCEKEDDNNTALLLPALKTSFISDFTKTTAKCGAIVTSDGGSKLTARGICWSTDTTPIIADAIFSDPYYSLGTGYYNCIITGLTANTTYYVRAYATNSKGTGYGNQQNFTTLPEPTYGSVSDIDGNIYKTVQIGTQVWMAENLRTTKYNDGTAIPLVTGDTAWVALTTPAYCWYNNDEATYKTAYGALYNRYTLDTTSNGGKNVCPVNWHVPTSAEWEILATYLGGREVAGGKLKESGIAHWHSPNTGATNATGFSALPGGSRLDNVSDNGRGKYYEPFNGIGEQGTWWPNAKLNYNDASLSPPYLRNDYNFYEHGRCVRCIKD